MINNGDSISNRREWRELRNAHVYVCTSKLYIPALLSLFAISFSGFRMACLQSSSLPTARSTRRRTLLASWDPSGKGSVSTSPKNIVTWLLPVWRESRGDCGLRSRDAAYALISLDRGETWALSRGIPRSNVTWYIEGSIVQVPSASAGWYRFELVDSITALFKAWKERVCARNSSRYESNSVSQPLTFARLAEPIKRVDRHICIYMRIRILLSLKAP